MHVCIRARACVCLCVFVSYPCDNPVYPSVLIRRLSSTGGLCACNSLLPPFQWAHSIRPDMVVMLEFDVEASGPFFLPRVRECFDFHASLFDCHDCVAEQSPRTPIVVAKCEPPAPARPKPAAVAAAAATAASRATKTAAFPAAAATTAASTATKTAAFPAAAAAAPTNAAAAASGSHEGTGELTAAAMRSLALPAPVRRSYMLMFEGMYFGRNILNIVASEGLDRMIRPDSLPNWRRRLQRLAFLPDSTIEAVREKVQRAVNKFPGGFGLRNAADSVLLMWQGKPLLAASVWSVDSRLFA